MAAALVAAVVLAVAPAAGAAVGPDYVTSDAVEYLGSIKYDVGQTTGARIVGDKLYVTGAKNLSVYDISTPEKPALIGTIHLNLAWENEEVPTNGKILGIANDWYDLQPNCARANPGIDNFDQVTHCQQLFDVSDPNNIKELPAVPQAPDHTSECVYNCSFLFGNTGTITDLRGVQEGTAQPKILGNWHTQIAAQLADQGYAKGVQSCHHIREISPGYMFAACEPFVYFSVNRDDPTDLTVLVTGANEDIKTFVHSVRWPRQAQDRFAFIGGETNFTFLNAKNGGDPTCDHKTNGAFEVFDAADAKATGKFPAKPVDTYRPSVGTYLDGNIPTHIAGCSVHWFQEHPSFHNGGLVALAAYDNGIRFLQVTPDGHIVEQGWFQPLGFETSSAKWVPGTDIVYSIDYARGIDILKWHGPHYVPDDNGVVQPEPGTTPGTNGSPMPVLPPLTAKQKAFAVREVSLLHKQGWFYGYCQLAAQRGSH